MSMYTLHSTLGLGRGACHMTYAGVGGAWGHARLLVFGGVRIGKIGVGTSAVEIESLIHVNKS